MKKANLILALIALPLAFTGCGDDGGSDDDGVTSVAATAGTAGTAADDGGTAPDDGGSADDGGTADTAGDTAGDTAADSSGGGGDGGFCGATCKAAADCGDETMFACTDGFCEFTGETPACDTTMCDDLMIGECADVDGASVCVQPCKDDTACIADITECTGSTDAGGSFCAGIACGGAAEGEACTFGGADSFGTCTDGVCGCSMDDECSAAGFACNS